MLASLRVAPAAHRALHVGHILLLGTGVTTPQAAEDNRSPVFAASHASSRRRETYLRPPIQNAGGKSASPASSSLVAVGTVMPIRRQALANVIIAGCDFLRLAMAAFSP